MEITHLPLYSIPHFSLQTTGLPVSPFRNGFGLTGCNVVIVNFVLPVEQSLISATFRTVKCIISSAHQIASKDFENLLDSALQIYC